MFSVMLALIAIFGIALTNLFLGFASAMLLGRGPKTWSDVDSAVSVRYFSPRLMFPGARRAAQPISLVTMSEPAAAAASVSVPSKDREREEPAAAPATVPEHVPAPAPGTSAAWDATTRKLVLPPKASSPAEDDGPPEAVLTRQLETWQASEAGEETPCLSGFLVTTGDAELDERTLAPLMRAVHESIAGQLRKDRRVLRIADNHFFWFSADVRPEEGLAPVERIRQILNNTRFLRTDNAIPVTVQAAVIAVSAQDNASTLIQRLRRTLQYALEKGVGPTCVDVGDGPSFVQPPALDLNEIQCVLE